LRPPLDKQLILDSLAAIARGAGRTPSRSEFVSLSGISEHQVAQFFPTWNDAVRAAGLRPNTLNVRLQDRELLEDWAFAVRRKRKIPARRAYRHLGQYDPRTFERRFGPWSKLPEVFRNFAQDKPEWADVVALLPVPLPRGTKGAPAPKPVRNPAQNEVRAPNGEPPSSLPLNNVRHAPRKDRPTYGNPIDFRGLRHEPVNEQGVVLLFGLVAKELGYIVEAVQSEFPDCEAKRQIGPERWQRVHIEFEFESRNFRDHGHPLDGCDVIVCWRHNWPDCPQQMEILELSTLIKSLPTPED
jgi:HNH endonuclease